ncbi:MAG TPA: SpoIIE family protein phosphatase [Acidobacteriaceae bacterium]|nr:SpoIIE family protein phosphatase [Acidobacteriaceae bacterium]
MRQLRCFLILLFVANCLSPSGGAQQRVIRLGQATAPLTGPWKFHIGDNMAWAKPGFDDSAWGTMDLTQPPGSVDPNTGLGGFVPGWTARGYPGHSGYAWYRLRVNIVQENASSVAHGANQALAIRMPDDFDDAYQLYVNGQLAGQFGEFSNRGVTYYFSQPRAFSLPTSMAASSPITIAIRMWMDAATPRVQPDTGGLHGPPVLGHSGIIFDLLRLNQYAIHLSGSSTLFEVAIQPLAILIAFTLFALDRNELAYLWLGISCTISFAFLLFLQITSYTTWISETYFTLLAVLPPLQIGVWILFWSYWFRLERTVQMAWLYRLTGAVVLLLAIAMAMQQPPLYGRVVPVQTIHWLSPIAETLNLLLGVVLIWVSYKGIRRNRGEGWLALTAVLLVGISRNVRQLAALHVPTGFSLVGIHIPLAQIGTVPSLAIITVLMLRRFLHDQRQREQFRQEMEQARQVQQMLIPEALPVVPGFLLESEYHPAQQVGGDFFQIIEGADGSLLAIVGDVSGKGLKAAMLVSLIVGTIRTLAKFTRDPMQVLRGLNERLCGRMQGHFATCMVAHIAANGETTLANAGHLAPYLNGAEIAVAGSLPLGIIEAADFSRIDFQLCENDRLTLMTDGVVEAQNEKRELFGFARTQQAGNQPATTLAQAAKKFGQKDDITVVSVVRSSVKMGSPGSRS